MSFRAHLRFEVLGGTGRATGLNDQWSDEEAAPPDSAAVAPTVANTISATKALTSSTDVGFAGFMS